MASVIHSDGWQGSFWQKPYIPTKLKLDIETPYKRWIIARNNIIEGMEAKK